jgi:hypothetical protein
LEAEHKEIQRPPISNAPRKVVDSLINFTDYTGTTEKTLKKAKKKNKKSEMLEEVNI